MNAVFEQSLEAFMERNDTEPVRTFMNLAYKQKYYRTVVLLGKLLPEEVCFAYSESATAYVMSLYELGQYEACFEAAGYALRQNNIQSLHHLRKACIETHPNLVERFTAYPRSECERANNLIYMQIHASKKIHDAKISLVIPYETNDSFRKTMNSFLACCTDIQHIRTWIFIGNESIGSKTRDDLREAYPFLDFYWKKLGYEEWEDGLQLSKHIVMTPYLFFLVPGSFFHDRFSFLSESIKLLRKNRDADQVLMNAIAPHENQTSNRLLPWQPSLIRTQSWRLVKTFNKQYMPEWKHLSLSRLEYVYFVPMLLVSSTEHEQKEEKKGEGRKKKHVSFLEGDDGVDIHMIGDMWVWIHPSLLSPSDIPKYTESSLRWHQLVITPNSDEADFMVESLSEPFITWNLNMSWNDILETPCKSKIPNLTVSVLVDSNDKGMVSFVQYLNAHATLLPFNVFLFQVPVDSSKLATTTSSILSGRYPCTVLPENNINIALIPFRFCVIPEKYKHDAILAETYAIIITSSSEPENQYLPYRTFLQVDKEEDCISQFTRVIAETKYNEIHPALMKQKHSLLFREHILAVIEKEIYLLIKRNYTHIQLPAAFLLNDPSVNDTQLVDKVRQLTGISECILCYYPTLEYQRDTKVDNTQYQVIIWKDLVERCAEYSIILLNAHTSWFVPEFAIKFNRVWRKLQRQQDWGILLLGSQNNPQLDDYQASSQPDIYPYNAEAYIPGYYLPGMYIISHRAMTTLISLCESNTEMNTFVDVILSSNHPLDIYYTVPAMVCWNKV